MKIAFLVLLGLILGTLGGAVLGVGAGLAWVEIFKTSNFEGYSGMLVFFGFMPGGAILGGLAGAIAFGLLAVRTGKSPSNGRQNRRGSHDVRNSTAFVQCKNADCLLKPSDYFSDQ
jgi:Na+/glutamate symporter